MLHLVCDGASASRMRYNEGLDVGGTQRDLGYLGGSDTYLHSCPTTTCEQTQSVTSGHLNLLSELIGRCVLKRDKMRFNIW